ncbi:hypothetical protein K2P56_02640 [Patescibacteria group bacterium]|nr:hypothetical protein [Patescibacteria group bacterium]
MLRRDKPVSLEHDKGLHSPKLRKYLWEWIHAIQDRHPHGRMFDQEGNITRTIAYSTYDTHHRRGIARELRVHRLQAEGMTDEQAVQTVRTKLKAKEDRKI